MTDLFPHPDDQAFGPGAAMAKQRRRGHRVEPLTLTRGGATKMRHGLGREHGPRVSGLIAALPARAPLPPGP